MTPKQQAFVDEYIKDFKGGPAYLRAGFKVSQRVAESNASRLLRNAEVQQSIAAAMEARSKRTQIDADWVLRTLADEKTADLADLFDKDGNLRPVKDWPAVFRRGVVVGIEAFEEYAGRGEDRVAVGMVRKVKLADRTKHLELIGRHVNVQAFKDRLEVEDVTDRAEQMRRARAKRLGQA